jgi:hypothetical protein
VTLKVKFADFQIITRSRSRVTPILDRSALASISAELLAAQFPPRKGVRLIGVSLYVQNLAGARDRDRPRFHRLRDLAHEVDVQEPVLQPSTAERKF